MEDNQWVRWPRFFEDCFHYVCDFVMTRFEHCNREANKVAHELARLARFSLTSDWFKEPSNEIVMILTNRCTSYFK